MVDEKGRKEGEGKREKKRRKMEDEMGFSVLLS